MKLSRVVTGFKHGWNGVLCASDIESIAGFDGCNGPPLAWVSNRQLARNCLSSFFLWRANRGMNKRLRNGPRCADDGLCQFGGYYSPGY